MASTRLPQPISTFAASPAIRIEYQSPHKQKLSSVSPKSRQYSFRHNPTKLVPRMTTPATPHEMSAVEMEFDWDEMWRNGVDPGEYFDKEYPSPALVAAVEAGWMPERTGTALIPGCGRGYDVELLARSDRFARVIGLDISSTAVNVARDYLNGRGLDAARWEVRCADFFDFRVEEKMQFVFDYTFLCALPLSMRSQWAGRMRELIADGGSLVTIMFPLGRKAEEGGPPHGVSFELFEELLGGKGFKAVDGPRMLDDTQCHARREGTTGYARWLRVD